MSESPFRPISRGSLVSCRPGSNKMSCFPFGPLMPLWASFCRSSMCHSETVALDTNQLVDLEINARQQVPPPSPAPPSMGKPRHGDDIEMSPSDSVSASPFPSHALQPRPSTSARSCRRHRATKRVLKRVPHEPSLIQPGGRALDPDLFK